MLYSEFVENTGCKETDYNHTIYKMLETLYMDDRFESVCTKEWVYESGKKLVDNSISEAQKRLNEAYEDEIAMLKAEIKKNAKDISRCREIIKIEKAGANEKWYIDCQRSTVKYLSNTNAEIRRRIESLKMSIVK